MPWYPVKFIILFPIEIKWDHFRNEPTKIIFLRVENGFNEENMKLLLCMVFLDPTNLFSIYDKIKLFRFVEFYFNKFSTVKLIVFEY